MAEVPLPGGNTTGAVLIDGVIHKRASPWTPTVHALLRYLEEAGFAGAPRALGFDSSGREMLSYLPGETIGDRDPWPAWVWADSMLVQVGQWLRRLHDLTAAFRPPADERWFIGGVMRPGRASRGPISRASWSRTIRTLCTPGATSPEAGEPAGARSVGPAA